MCRSTSLITVFGLLLAGHFTTGAPFARSESTSRFFVVRHADRASEVASDRLTLDGMRRAEELSRVLASYPISAVYATKTRRTFQTATPTALSNQVEITPYDTPIGSSAPERLRVAKWRTWAEPMLQKHVGENVLIVGHSDTVAEIVRGLLGDRTYRVTPARYEDLFVVTVDDGDTTAKRHSYHVIKSSGNIEFAGDVFGSIEDEELAQDMRENVSAAATTENGCWLIIGPDEGTHVQGLERDGDQYRVSKLLDVRDPDLDESKEFDIEGITRHGTTNEFFVVGSHAYRRKNIFRKRDADSTYTSLRKRFEHNDESPDRESNRERLIRIKIDPDSGELVGPPADLSLRDALDSHHLLDDFSKVPSKENGIDIEGIASDGESLYLGCRGPVLRFGLVPVLVVSPEGRIDACRYVMLNGAGIRDIARVNDGFLIISGAVGDGGVQPELWFWDGGDCFPGQREEGDPPKGKTTPLGTIPSPRGANPEALVILGEDPDTRSYELMVLYDGAVDGAPQKLRATFPVSP